MASKLLESSIPSSGNRQWWEILDVELSLIHGTRGKLFSKKKLRAIRSTHKKVKKKINNTDLLSLFERNFKSDFGLFESHTESNLAH